jgi:hypothetical protein
MNWEVALLLHLHAVIRTLSRTLVSAEPNNIAARALDDHRQLAHFFIFILKSKVSLLRYELF